RRTHRQFRRYGDVDLGVETVSEPAGANVGHLVNLRHVLRSVPDLLEVVRLDAVEHPQEHGLDGLPHDPENSGGDDRADDRISDRIAKPDADGAEQHREAGPAVDAGMLAIGDESGTADLSAHPHAEERDALVAGETDNRGGNDRPELRDVLRMEEALNRLITCDDSADENCQHDGNAGKILDAAIAEGEPFARSALAEHEGDGKRNGGGRVADIVDRVGEERDEAPFDRPDAPCRAGDRRIDDAVGVAVPVGGVIVTGHIMPIAMALHVLAPLESLVASTT